MKIENIEEAKTIVNRIRSMEQAIQFYDATKKKEFSWNRLFVNLFRGHNKSEFEVQYKGDVSIALSMKQQDELSNLVRKWITEDKKRLEEL
jgi:hypothetical protein